MRCFDSIFELGFIEEDAPPPKNLPFHTNTARRMLGGLYWQYIGIKPSSW